MPFGDHKPPKRTKIRRESGRYWTIGVRVPKSIYDTYMASPKDTREAIRSMIRQNLKDLFKG